MRAEGVFIKGGWQVAGGKRPLLATCCLLLYRRKYNKIITAERALCYNQHRHNTKEIPMPKKRAVNLADLPQKTEDWGIGVVLLRTWIAPPGETPYRPWLVMGLDLTNQRVVAHELFQSEPQPKEIFKTLAGSMVKPIPGGGRARRPSAIYTASNELADSLTPMLTEIGIQCGVADLPMIPHIVGELESHMRGGEPEHPGLLSVDDVTPTLAGGVFAAAAAFYRAAPWVQLANEHTIAVRFPANGGKTRIAVVMGNAGVEYGLAIYETWEDVVKLFTEADDPFESIPAQGHLALFYDDMSKMPFDDLDALQEHGWEVADEQAYPVPIVMFRNGDFRRPNPEELQWLEAALRAVPIFARDHLRSDGRGDYQPAESILTVSAHVGDAAAHVKYPAGVLPREQRPAVDPVWESSDDETDEMPVFERRLMESTMADFGRLMGAEESLADRKLQKAQDMMYKAWEERNPAKRIALAHKAIATSDKCADAYVLLAEEQADSVARALEYYQRGMEAGERALGKEYFREAVGHFWGLLETRPYMRARQGVADCLLKLHRTDEAIAHYREMLRLNPSDNQGIRYVLLAALVELDRNTEALDLMKKYKDDGMADWAYTWALLEYRAKGPAKTAERRLKEALRSNTHVPEYILGQKRVPNRLPPYISPGRDDEAAHYASKFLNEWRRTPGAVEWLKSKLP